MSGPILFTLKSMTLLFIADSVVGVKNRQLVRDVVRTQLIATRYKSRRAVRSTLPLLLSYSALLFSQLIPQENHDADAQQTI